MHKMIKNLRELPIKQRRHILHLCVMILGLGVFGLWTLTLKHNLQSTEAELAIMRSTRPLVDFGSQLAGTYNAFEPISLPNTNPIISEDTGIIELRSTIQNGQR